SNDHSEVSYFWSSACSFCHTRSPAASTSCSGGVGQTRFRNSSMRILLRFITFLLKPYQSSNLMLRVPQVRVNRSHRHAELLRDLGAGFLIDKAKIQYLDQFRFHLSERFPQVWDPLIKVANTFRRR